MFPLAFVFMPTPCPPYTTTNRDLLVSCHLPNLSLAVVMCTLLCIALAVIICTFHLTGSYYLYNPSSTSSNLAILSAASILWQIRALLCASRSSRLPSTWNILIMFKNTKHVDKTQCWSNLPYWLWPCALLLPSLDLHVEQTWTQYFREWSWHVGTYCSQCHSVDWWSQTWPSPCQLIIPPLLLSPLPPQIPTESTP